MLTAAFEAIARARETPGDTGPRDALAAVQAVLDRLRPYDHALLAARGWALFPETQQQLTAERIGVTKTNVERNLPRAYARVRQLLAEPAHLDAVEHARLMREQLGPLIRLADAEAALLERGMGLMSDAGQLLLHLAGPYTASADHWFEDAGLHVLAAAAAIMDSAFARGGAPTTAALVDGLGGLGIPRRTAIEFIASRPELRRFGDKWVPWGASIVELLELFEDAAAPPA